ncbi:MAG: FMN-binding protein [Oscillospiraceae bacterium]|nr:FMN-binding protein [Oscillospiraceae bacterium]
MKRSFLLPLLTILLAAAVLLGASAALQGVAAANAQKEHLKIMQTLLPGSTEFTLEPYSGEDATIRSVHKGEGGFVIETVTAGYAGQITMLIGVNNDGAVTGLVVREMSETLGLGWSALNDHVFLSQFLNVSGQVAVGQPGADAFSGATGSDSAEAEVYVDAISGATVTSKAIARCVNAAVAYVTGADIDSGATSWGG